MNAGAPVLIMAGGTGGHIFPGLAVAAALRARGVPVAWLGSAGGMEVELVQARDIPLHLIKVRGLRGTGWRANARAPWMLLRAFGQAWRVLHRVRPRAVLALGGFAAGPGGLVAWLQRRPLVVHEQNSIPGLTNRILARRARRVLSGFPDAFPAAVRAEWTGNPVRAAIAAIEPPATRLAGRAGPPRLLVLGGSRGAQRLNRLLPQALSRLDADARPDVWHQSGNADLEGTRTAWAEAGLAARVEPFITDMAAAYAWADLCLCRAGALTLAELTAAGLGALLVPYPYAVDDHQTRNAATLVEVGAARSVPERDLDGAALADRLAPLLADRARQREMAAAARRLAQPDAAERIADACLEVAA